MLDFRVMGLHIQVKGHFDLFDRTAIIGGVLPRTAMLSLGPLSEGFLDGDTAMGYLMKNNRT